VWTLARARLMLRAGGKWIALSGILAQASTRMGYSLQMHSST